MEPLLPLRSSRASLRLCVEKIRDSAIRDVSSRPLERLTIGTKMRAPLRDDDAFYKRTASFTRLVC